MDTLAIHHQWESALHESPEVAHTSAMLRIVLGRDVVTRNEDDWAQTVRDDVRLSAYPLALWFASSWWRLRWEPLPTSAPSNSWRMSHELRAAGHGYVWPRMLFASDGENVHAWAVQSKPESKAPVRYLVNTYCEVAAETFERTVDEFVTGVLARLDAVGVQSTPLHALWSEIVEERKDRQIGSERKLEAMLGFDPDDGPQSLLSDMKRLISRAGAAAVDEIAPVCASVDPGAMLNRVVAIAESRGFLGKIDIPRTDKLEVADDAPSWEHGRALAKSARARLGLNGDPISDATLCGLVGLKAAVLRDIPPSMSRMPLGVAIRADNDSIKFVLRKRQSTGRRFEIARFLCDYLIASQDDRWLPTTDQKTSRQKAQRAFAGEFLCPIEPLKDFLQGDFSNDAIDEAAERFGVSTRAVETQLVNHRVLPPEILGSHGARFDFPYVVDSFGT